MRLETHVAGELRGDCVAIRAHVRDVPRVEPEAQRRRGGEDEEERDTEGEHVSGAIL